MFTLKLFLTRMVKRNYEVVPESGRPLEGGLTQKKSPEQEEVEKALKAFDEYRKNGGKDHIVLIRLLNSIHEANEKFAKKNQEASDKIDADISNAIKASTDMNPADVVQIHNYHIGLRRKRLEAARSLEKQSVAQASRTNTDIAVTKTDVSKTQLDAMNKRAGLTEAVDAKDNNPRQAEALLKGLAMMKDNKGAQALLKRLTTDNNGENYISLSSLNIGAFMDWMAHGMKVTSKGWRGTAVEGYRTNGMDNGETLALQKIADAMKGNPELIALAKTVRAFYDASQTSEDWLIALGKKETPAKAVKPEEVIAYLSTYREGTSYQFKKVEGGNSKRLETADRSFFTPFDENELKGYFEKMTPEDLITRVKDIIRLGGGLLDKKFNTPAELFQAMNADPMLRANYIRGLNLVAMTPNRAEYFAAGKIVLGIVAEKAVKLVEEIKEKDMLERMRAGVEKGAEKNKDAVAKNLALTPEQRKAILDGIDKFVSRMQSNTELKSVVLDGMLVLTNKGAAVGGGATMSLDTMLADTLSAGGSLATDYRGGFGAAISLAMTKELYHSMKADFGVHYGIMAASGGLSPFAGAHGTYEDFIAAVTKGPGFVNIFLGMKVGQNTEMIRNLQGLSSSQKEIYELAVKNNIETVSMKNLVSDPAIAARMDRTIQSILTMNGFKPELSNEVRYAMVYAAVVEAMNQEVLLLRRESNDNGWVMKQIGLNFGKIAGLAYILPGFGIGRDDLRVEIEEGKLKMNKTVALKDVDAKKLLEDSGYTFSDSFDAVKQEKKFVISGKSKAAPTVVVPSNIAGRGAGKVSVDQVNDSITVTAGRNIELVADRSVDGKITITVKDKGVFEKTITDTTETQALNGIDLTKDGGFEKLMQTKEARVALANAFFWGNSELTQFLAAYHKADMSDAKTFVEGVTPKLSALLAKNKNNKAIALIIESLGQNTFNFAERMSKIVRIRTGFMTDVSNTSELSVDTNGFVNFSVKEGVKKNWESRKSSAALKALARGIDLSKFDGLMNTDAKTYKAISGDIGGVDTNKLIGVVAGYKGGQEAHGFSVIPKGMMSVAQAGGKALIEEMTTADATEKVYALGLIATNQPKMREKMMAGIEASVKVVTGAKKVDIVEINELLTTGKATINGKAVTSTAKFYRIAFGECLNTPSYGIDLGVVTSAGKTETVKDGSSMSGSRVDQTEITNKRTRTTLDSLRLNFAGGTIADRELEPPSTTTTPRVTPDPAPTNTNTTPNATRVEPVTPPAGAGGAPATAVSGTAGGVGAPVAAPPGAGPAVPPPPGAGPAPAPVAPVPVAPAPAPAPAPVNVVDATPQRASAGVFGKMVESTRITPDN